jgi:nucleoside-diphosphate-sugar epimerase
MADFRSALITGATGFVGSALARRLTEEGISVYCLVRNNGRDRQRLKALKGIELIEIRSSETRDLQKALRGISADVVFNLASYGVDQKDCDPEVMIDGNINFVTRLLLAVTEWPLKQFFHTGSCSEYGAPLNDEPLTEEHPLRTLSLYGAAKAASVLYGSALASRLRIPFVTLRLFGIYGVGEGPNRLIPYIIEHLERDEPVDLTPGEQVRDLLYVDDVVEAFLTAGRRYSSLKAFPAYNVCSGVAVRIRDVGEAVARAADKSFGLLQWGQRTYRPDEPMWLVGNNRRFVEATGWQPKVTLSNGIKRMVCAAKNDAYA